MVRPSDPFWVHVEELTDGQWECKFCGHKFSSGISISRIKSHLAGVEGRGIKICTQVQTDVRQEAFQAIQEKPKSSNEVSSNVSTSSGKPNDEVVEIGDAVPISDELRKRKKRELDKMYRERKKRASIDYLSLCSELRLRIETLEAENNRLRERIQLTKEMPEAEIETLQEIKLTREQAEAEIMKLREIIDEFSLQSRKVIGSQGLVNFSQQTTGDVSQESDPVSRAFERNSDQIYSQSAVDDVLINEVVNIARNDALPTTSEPVGQAFEGNKAASPKTTELVSQAFEENKKAIWSWLRDDDVPSIGIYGMGGVGKTQLVKHIYNQLHELADSTYHLYWITVSPNFSLHRLQNLIANRIGLDLSSEDNKLLRADELSKHLKNEQKWVLILDDLWNYFDPDKVGIPIQTKGCKLILTTRSLEVCRRVGCKKKIKVEPLSEDEAWTLFMEKLGHDVALSPDVEQIAKSVARKCAGLPLGIITMAVSMRGVDDICEWRNAWKELKDSKVRLDDMEIEVFRVLRFSYTHLKDASLQQCFLCCTFFPEDHLIEREKLLTLLRIQGIVNGNDNYDKGHVMLNKLENVCLLESCVDSNGLKCVKMHHLIRDMAIQIQQENSQVSVKANAQ